jgi:hypothetical protein
MRKLSLLINLPILFFLAGCNSTSKASYEPMGDREGIRAVFQMRMKELRNCYYETLDANPAAEGKVVLAFDLGDDGKARNTKIESFKGRRGIEKIEPCLVMRVNSWQFPKPAPNEQTVVAYPLYFSENGRTNFDDVPSSPSSGPPAGSPAKPSKAPAMPPDSEPNSQPEAN